MAEPPKPPLISQLAIANKIDSVCDQFEQDWKAGRKPTIEACLARCDEAAPAALKALLEVEIELLASVGKRPGASDYLRRFPEHGELVRQAFAHAASSPAGAGPENTSTLQAPSVETSHIIAERKASGAEPVSSALPDRIGRFLVLARLGEGAFGTVYRARDPHLEREVAIKLPRDGVLATEDDRARFLREAKIAATLNHPNLCPVFEVGELDGHPYIVMALIEGKTLAHLIKSGKPIDPRNAVAAVRRIASALAEAHGKGIVHRDLKPLNIMVNRRGEPIVMDFGLARLSKPGDARLTQSGQIMGSPAYMSPEQARGATDQIGPASDIYSLGVILYEILCGERPFKGTVTEVLGQILHVEPPPPSQHKGDVDPALEAICLKAMGKDPAKRYGSMREFSAALGDYLKANATATQDAPSAQTASATYDGSDDGDVAVSDTSVLTPQTIEEAVGRHARDTWRTMLVTLGALGLMLVAGIIVLSTRTNHALVQIVLETEIDSQLVDDGTVRFALDGRPVPPADLKRPIELTPGEHTLVAWRGESEVQRYVFVVRQSRDGRDSTIAIKERTPYRPAEKQPPVPREPSKATPSPLDQLDPQNIAAADRFPWQPSELVAVYGDHRGAHWGAIHSLALSPDGATLVTASEDATIGLWDAHTLLARGSLIGHEGPVNWIAFTSSGEQLLSAGADGTVRLWNVEDRRETQKFTGHTRPVRCVAVTPDGQHALSCGDDATIRLWRLETGEEIRKFDKHKSAVWKVCLTADGKRVLSGSDDRTMRYWDLEAGKDVVEFENERPGPKQYRAIALSPDGARAACGSSQGEQNFATMRLFDTATGKEAHRSRGEVKHYGHGMEGVVYPGSQAFSSDGEWLLSGAWSPANGNSLLLWNGKTGKLERKFGEQATGATAVLLSHDGKRAYTGSSFGRVRVWSVETGEDLAPPTGHESFVASVALAPDGRSLLTGSEDLSVRLWDTLSGKQQVHRTDQPGLPYSDAWKTQFSSNGETALFYGGLYTAYQMDLWDVQGWRALGKLQEEWKKGVLSAAFSPDGRQILAGLDSGLQLWNSARPETIRRLAGHVGPCTSVSFFPDGQRAVTGGRDKFLRLWDLVEGRELKRIGPLSGETRCLVSPDGQRVAVASLSDGSLRLYDSQLKHETPFPGTVSPPAIEMVADFAAAFTPDSQALAVANNQGQIVIWDLNTKEKRRAFKLPGEVYDLASDSTGRYLATANHNGTAYLLRLAPAPGGTAPETRTWQRPVDVPTPVAHWSFDEGDSTTFIDQIGTVPPGRAGGLRRQPGVVGDALQLEGSEPRVALGPGGQPKMVFGMAMSIAVWARPEADGAGDLVQRNAGYALRWLRDHFEFNLRLVRKGGNVSFPVPAPAVADRWTLVAGVYDGNRISIYLDGRLVQSRPISANRRVAQREALHGLKPPYKMFAVDSGWPNEVGGGYRGLLDELQVFDAALTSEQVQSLFASYPSPDEP